MLDVENLKLSYGAHVVLTDVEVHVAAGETVAVLGPNGAGKTTLLRSIAGLHRPAAGRITLEGQEISRRRPEAIVRRGVRLVPQGRRVFARLTVRENLEVGAWVGDRRRRSAEIERLMDVFPVLGERAHQLAGSLSGGEQSMLALARGLVVKPRVLCLDEPSLGLAPVMVGRIARAIREVAAERGISVLLVEQNARLALELASRAYILGGGGVQLEGRAGDLAGLEDVRDAYFGGGVT